MKTQTFLNATAFTCTSKGKNQAEYEINFADEWLVGAVPNGGYTLAILSRIMCDINGANHPHPQSITAHYLLPLTKGAAKVKATVVGQSRARTTVSLQIWQQEELKIMALGCASNIEFLKGDNFSLIDVPSLPTKTVNVDTMKGSKSLASFIQSTGLSYEQQSTWWTGERKQRPEIIATGVMLEQTQNADLHSCVMHGDSLTPPIFAKEGAKGWVATLELTVHIMNRPAPGEYVLVGCNDMTQRGVQEINMNLWDSTGKPIVRGRQIAKYKVQHNKISS